MTIDERLAEIERQIEELKNEKKILKSQNIASLVNRKILLVFKDRTTGEKTTGARGLSRANDVWNPILSLAKELCKPNYPKHKKLMISDLSREEIEHAAAMATEMVDIWNKHVLKVYGDETDDK